MATFQNMYYKRTTATAKPCYMCYRPTTTVLATINTMDFLYTCDGHLMDHEFAVLIEPPPPDEVIDSQNTKKVSDEEIRRIKEEWEERQRRKEEKVKEHDKDKDLGEGKNKEQGPKTQSPKLTPPPPTPIPVPGSTAAAKPTHQRYSLHREVFAMRLREHRKKRQNTALKEIAPRLPITPRGGIA